MEVQQQEIDEKITRKARGSKIIATQVIYGILIEYSISGEFSFIKMQKMSMYQLNYLAAIRRDIFRGQSFMFSKKLVENIVMQFILKQKIFEEKVNQASSVKKMDLITKAIIYTCIAEFFLKPEAKNNSIVGKESSLLAASFFSSKKEIGFVQAIAQKVINPSLVS